MGLAVNSFTSVSIDPPLVSFCASHRSTSWPHVRAAGSFCVNILGEDQEALARAVAVKGGHKFGGVAWLPAGRSGSPILTAALAWIDCTIEAEHDAGDHVIVVGRANEMAVACEGRPLLFYRWTLETSARGT